MAAKSVEVSIMGQKFMVRSDSDDQYVVDVANFVNKKIADIISKTKSVPSLNVVLLAAMNIADEHFKYKNKKDQTFQQVEKKIAQMIEFIDLQM
jgi:cell division protein ZapA